MARNQRSAPEPSTATVAVPKSRQLHFSGGLNAVDSAIGNGTPSDFFHFGEREFGEIVLNESRLKSFRLAATVSLLRSHCQAQKFRRDELVRLQATQYQLSRAHTEFR